MNVVQQIRDDWKANQAERTNAIDGKPWGWQWGGNRLFRQVEELHISQYLLSPLLDVGCGGGKWEKWLVDHGIATTGVDVHRVAIEDAHRYEPRASYRLIEGEGLEEFRNSSFRTVFIFDVLLHLPQTLVLRYFEEARRVATDTLVFSLPDMGTGFGGKKMQEMVRLKAWRQPYKYGYMSYYTFPQVERMLQLAGWRRVLLLGHVGSKGDRDMVVACLKGDMLAVSDEDLYRHALFGIGGQD